MLDKLIKIGSRKPELRDHIEPVVDYLKQAQSRRKGVGFIALDLKRLRKGPNWTDGHEELVEALKSGKIRSIVSAYEDKLTREEREALPESSRRGLESLIEDMKMYSTKDLEDMLEEKMQNLNHLDEDDRGGLEDLADAFKNDQYEYFLGTYKRLDTFIKELVPIPVSDFVKIKTGEVGEYF